MIRALAIKELRESAVIIAVTALAMSWLLSDPFSRADQVPFIETSFVMFLAFFGGTFSLALGLKQSAWESHSQKYYYLLHLPVARQTIFQTKLIFGLALLLFFTAGPILIHAYKTATPGYHTAPFFWGMTADAWRTCWTLPSIYLGAFLSGLWPGRWFGTRMLPLLGAGILALAAIGAWFLAGWIMGLASLLILDFVLLRLILATANRRDY